MASTAFESAPLAKSHVVHAKEWSGWARAVLLLGPLILIVGGFVAAAVAKNGQSLTLGIVSAVVGALLVAQVPSN